MKEHSIYDLLAWFFDDLDEEYCFSPLEVAIYWRLVHKCNRRKWSNPFPFPCDDLRGKVRAKNADSKKAFDTARNRLKQAGLIDFKAGLGRSNVTHYSIFFPKKERLKGIQKEHFSAHFSEHFSAHFSELHKKDKDIDKDSKSHSEKSAISRQPKKQKPELTEQAVKFAEWFRTLLPQDRDTTAKDLSDWAATFDELIRLDNRTKEEIIRVVKWARADDFWKDNFLSACKLRKKDKSGTKYYDIFLNRMRSSDGTIKHPNGNGKHTSSYEQRIQNGQRSVNTLIRSAEEFARELV